MGIRAVLRAFGTTVIMTLASGLSSWAHTSLGEYVQHRYALSVSSKNLDLNIELTFNGEPARLARASMDTDHDGAISREELKAQGTTWESACAEQLALVCGKESLPVAVLYAPEIDLEGEKGLEPHPFAVRLKCFVRTPATLKPGDAIRIESKLQGASPALVVLMVSSDLVAPVTSEPGHGDILPALKSGSRTFTIRCPRFARPDSPPASAGAAGSAPRNR